MEFQKEQSKFQNYQIYSYHMNFNKIQPYLPSKQFQKVVLSLIILVVLGFGIFYFFSKDEKFSRNDDLEINKKTIYEIIDTDTDLDQVPDWEEKLWGTNPNKQYTFEGVSDSEYIENKKKALNLSESNENEKLTETETFAREFFTAYLALKGQDGVNETDIASFSDALGQKIANPTINNSYTESQIKIRREDDYDNQVDYYQDISNLFNKYKENGLGDELSIVSKGLLTYQNEGKIGKYNELLLIGESYQEFAKKAIEIQVPPTLSSYHLDIINAANNTGISVINMSKVIEDPIIGLSGLSSYQKYSDELVEAVKKLENFFE